MDIIASMQAQAVEAEMQALIEDTINPFDDTQIFAASVYLALGALEKLLEQSSAERKAVLRLWCKDQMTYKIKAHKNLKLTALRTLEEKQAAEWELAALRFVVDRDLQKPNSEEAASTTTTSAATCDGVPSSAPSRESTADNKTYNFSAN